MKLREGQTVHKQDFLDYSYNVPVDSDSLVLSLTERNSCYPALAFIMAVRGGGTDHHSDCALKLISMPSH